MPPAEATLDARCGYVLATIGRAVGRDAPAAAEPGGAAGDSSEAESALHSLRSASGKMPRPDMTVIGAVRDMDMPDSLRAIHGILRSLVIYYGDRRQRDAQVGS